MGFWNNLKNKVNDLSDKSEKWFNKNVNDKIKQKQEEFKKELVCKECGAKLPNNILKDVIVCEYCGAEQQNPKYLFVDEEQNEEENDK